jgi:penicillin-binding protein 2
MQIIQGEHFAELAERNSIRLVNLRAPRGTIYDRNRAILAQNAPLFRVVAIPGEVTDKNRVARRVSELLALDEENVLKKIDARNLNPFLPVLLVSGISLQETTVIKEHQGELPGVFVETVPRRDYPHGSLAFHIIGYVGKISAARWAELRELGYPIDHIVGKYGIESSFDASLQGKYGAREVLVNVMGEEIKILSEREPVRGNDIILTIDLRLQEIVERNLKGKRGSIVAIDPLSGNILAMASYPVIDPNIFTVPLDREKFAAIMGDPARPFLNRAISGTYPPGSTFKIITAMAGLEKGVIDSKTHFHCHGVLRRARASFHCWYEGGHGRVNVTEALAASCNIFFYEVAALLGVKNIEHFARSSGLGELTGIDLPREARGNIPQAGGRERWSLGDIFHLGIGQGEILVTSLQMTALMAAVANGGVLYRPRFVSEIRSPQGEIIEVFPAEPRKRLPVSERTLDLVRYGMWKTVNETWGTGRRAALPEVEVAGKTGTAQVVGLEFRGREEVPFEFRHHAWFFGFAPFENPKIALTVMIEHGESGGIVAAPIAQKIFKEFLK